jgi:hypothetical protein
LAALRRPSSPRSRRLHRRRVDAPFARRSARVKARFDPAEGRGGYHSGPA